MKFYSILILLLLNTELTFSQFDYGLKIGLNFDSAGKIKLASDQLEKQGALNSKTGHHFGIYTEVDFLIFYIRPELQFTKVISQFEDNLIDTARIELPVSLGVTLMGPLSFFLGPIAYYNFSHKSNELKLEEIQKKTSLGLNIGTRVRLGALGVDLRYERAFSAIETKILSEAEIPVVGQLNTQTNQFTLGVSFKLN